MRVVAAIAAGLALLIGGCANVALQQDGDSARILVGSREDRPEKRPLVSQVAPLFAQYAWLAVRSYDDSLYGLSTGHKSDIVCTGDATCSAYDRHKLALERIWGRKPVIARINDCSPEAAKHGPVKRDFDHGGRPGRCDLDQQGKDRVLDGLGIQIWVRRSCSELAVVFRGTDFNQSDDWLSNLRWVTRVLPLYDQYEQTREHVDRLIDEALARLGPACRPRRIISVGHSLGGGLAQHAAYAQKPRPGRPAIARVYAFDPSFVTGFYDRSIDPALRDGLTRAMKIDRVYEHGEILAYPRFVLRNLYPPSPCSPQVRLVRLNLLHGSITAQHSMADFTRRLLAASGRPDPRIAEERGILPPAPEAIGETGECRPPAIAAPGPEPGDRRLETTPDITLVSLR